MVPPRAWRASWPSDCQGRLQFLGFRLQHLPAVQEIADLPHERLVLVEDLTEARRIEAVRRDFVANVSHELKTPVGALSLLPEAVMDACDDPEAVTRFAGRMQAEAARLSQLVQEIIELSRLQTAGTLEQLRLVDVDSILAEAADRAQTTAAARKITIDVGGATGLAVFGDRNLLVTAVRNLLDNAVNYTPSSARQPGMVTARVLTDPFGGALVLQVEDTGPGIPQGERELVFQPFYRALGSNVDGSGLGLPIVQEIARQHQARIEIDDAHPGRLPPGTRVTVLFEPEVPRQAQPSAAETSAGA